MEGQAPHLEANAFEIERVHKYENTPKLWFTGPTTMRHGLNETETLWTDNKLMMRSGVELRRLEFSLLFSHSQEFLRMIMNGNSENSEYSAKLILLLAWNIISPTTGGHMFPKIDPTATDNDVPFILSNAPQQFHPQWNASIPPYYMSYPAFMSGCPYPVYFMSDPQWNASIPPYFMSDPAFQTICATTYTAMSLLRLFTKWPKSYIRSWNQINVKFSASYGFEYPYRWYRPSKKSLEEIFLHFKSNIILKNGLTGILYMHEKSPMDRELRDYLFGHHLECFNLHAFPLFMSVGKKLQCDAVDLLSALLTACPQQETALDCLHVILTDFVQFPQEDRCLQTWKYARLYETCCFDSLSTFKCRRLVAVLAHLVKLCQAVCRYGADVLRITALKDLSAEEISDCKQKAEMIHAALMEKRG